MQVAIREAKKALKEKEVPVGAVAVCNGDIVARGHNVSIKKNDPTGHAEIIVLRRAARKLGNYRLTNLSIYATIKPCQMCAGALANARVKEVVYGTSRGEVTNVMNIPKTKITGGVLKKECKKLIQDFFQDKRKIKDATD